MADFVLKSRRKGFLVLGVFALFLMGTHMNAQLQKGQLIDGVAAVIGDEVVLESDVDENIMAARQQGAEVDDRCQVLENIVQGKLLLYQAKKDTLIEDRSKALREQAEQRYQQMLTGFPTERDMLNTYNFRTSYEMVSAIEKINTESYYQGRKYSMITNGVDVTPSEVSAFYNTFKTQLPQVNNEVKLSRIVMFPKLTDEHKQEIIDKLKRIREDIISGKETFENEARIYSEDPGSAANGGLITNVARGMMVRPFEAAALNLQEGEISNPVETEFGYHLIQLVKKSGKTYDVRHILILATPKDDEIKTAKEEMKKIRQEILDGEISFKDAALKYSDDKSTKFNAGVMTGPDGSDNLEKTKLDPNDAYRIIGLNKGDITEPYEVDFAEGSSPKKAIELIQINDVIDAHTLDYSEDYARVRAYALNKKESEVVEEWIKSKLPETFFSINNRYNSCSFKTDWTRTATAK